MNTAELHRKVIDHAGALTDGRALVYKDLDTYMLALMQLVLTRDVPCDLDTLVALHNLAESAGYE